MKARDTYVGSNDRTKPTLEKRKISNRRRNKIAKASKRANRSAFTMIELIFVIVILGILAAIAIPKLAATRDDASASKMATDISVVITDMAGRYLKDGVLDTWQNVTNVKLMTNSTTEITATTAVTTPVYLFNNANQCISFTATTGGALTVANGSNTTDKVCALVQVSQLNKMGLHQF